jgi:hypothetical protein
MKPAAAAVVVVVAFYWLAKVNRLLFSTPLFKKLFLHFMYASAMQEKKNSASCYSTERMLKIHRMNCNADVVAVTLSVSYTHERQSTNRIVNKVSQRRWRNFG